MLVDCLIALKVCADRVALPLDCIFVDIVGNLMNAHEGCRRAGGIGIDKLRVVQAKFFATLQLGRHRLKEYMLESLH